jgi:2-keto-4-pentenoate hydratase/2-oxohepta-3-ene-1,7-dioic acid hydratase in catechol pathway
MKFGVIQEATGTAVVMPLGADWLHLSRAWLDYNQHVEGREAAPLRTLQDLIDQNLLNRTFYRRMAEFAQRHGRHGMYTLETPPRFILPWRPGKVVAIARNYRAHAQELGNAVPTEPMFFGKVGSSCIGPEEPILIQDWYGRVDFEGEIGVVIGKRATAIKAEDAREYVSGYTLVNDVTARDLQNADKKAGHPWFRAKNMDTFCPIGPVLLLADAFPWPLEVDVETRVNGAVRQQGNTRQFIFSVGELLAAVTRCVTLEPGDIVATGTPEGVGPMLPGEVVEVSNPEIGVLRNPLRRADAG